MHSCSSIKNNEVAELQTRKISSEDSTQWNNTLFIQDKETYTNHQDYLSNLPMHLAAFPVADYDYGVAGVPFDVRLEGKFTYGFSVGAYADANAVDPTLEVALFFISHDSITEENTFVQSRNYPSLTAQGMVKTSKQTYDWIFVQDMDQPGWVIVNMKLFNLQLGKTIIILIQNDGSFIYKQLDLDPKDFDSPESYTTALRKML